MHHALTRDATALHDTEVAILLAVLVAAMNFQVHVCWQNAGIFIAWEGGRSGKKIKDCMLLNPPCLQTQSGVAPTSVVSWTNQTRQ